MTLCRAHGSAAPSGSHVDSKNRFRALAGSRLRRPTVAACVVNRGRTSRYASIMASILLDGVTVQHEGVAVIRDLTLTVEDRELIVIIGPSGSGKTSLLRVVAGLDSPAGGEILFDGVDATGLPPSDRDIAMVFQDTSLIPFRSVRRNISFPLEVHRVERAEIDRRVAAEARTVTVDRFLDAMPDHLAAGHQQLVQAARALVRRPSVFLLDEPLARMDAAQRRTVRGEIRLLQRGYGVTTIYATNDQEDAMALADRIAVIDEGRLRQVGTPADVYHKPVDMFVAGFLGSPPMSFIDGFVAELEVRIGAGALPVPPGTLQGRATVGVRAHDWEIVPSAGLQGVVTAIENHGGYVLATIDLAGESVVARFDDPRPQPGDRIEIWTRRFHLFDPSGAAVAHVG